MCVCVYIYVYIYIYIFLFFLLFFIDATLSMPLKCVKEITYSVMYHVFIKHVFYRSLNIERI